MKRLLTLAFALALACAMPVALSACNQADTPDGTVPETEGSETGSESSENATSPFATLGEAFAEDPESLSYTFDEARFVMAFNRDGAWWRLEAPLPEGLYEELDEAWSVDMDKVVELVSPLEIAKATVLEPLDAESIEACVGKTGADLTADGFAFQTGTLVVNGDETLCVATLGDFDYLVTFEGAVADEGAEDVAAEVAEMTVVDMGNQGPTWAALAG